MASTNVTTNAHALLKAQNIVAIDMDHLVVEKEDGSQSNFKSVGLALATLAITSSIVTNGWGNNDKETAVSTICTLEEYETMTEKLREVARTLFGINKAVLGTIS